MSRWTQGLNPEQIRAVEHVEGPMLILAGAGSGKTTVLVSRTGRLLDQCGLDPARLCVLTFTNKAARELKYRVSAKLGNLGQKVWAGTFHSFGVGIIRKYARQLQLPIHFGILDPSDAGAIAKELLSDFQTSGKTAYDADRLLSMMTEWREKGKTEADKDEEYEEAVEWLLPRYLRKLKMLGMVDFDGLILEPIHLFETQPDILREVQARFEQVMVDEFQDTNLMQMRLVRHLASTHNNLTVVGDDDQSIYGWRGACVSNILDFPKLYDNCTVIRLERNYRSTSSILKLANTVIEKNTKRHGKVLRSQKAAEAPLPELFVFADEEEEAECVIGDIAAFVRDGTKRRDIAVLYRSNSQGAFFEAGLRTQDIPYSITGGIAFFDRKEIRDVLAYLRCAVRPNEVAFRRILNTPSRGIGDRSIEKLNQVSLGKRGAFIRAARDWRTHEIDERAGAGIESFFDGLNSLLIDLSSAPAGEASPRLLNYLERIGYRKHLEKISSSPMAVTKRWRVVEIFANILDRHLERKGVGKAGLESFLESMELRDALEDEKENEDRVQLLTLHACKGLEFPCVFLVGVEEDLIPHRMLGQDVDEERRLFYVGITRAQERLILTRAQKRRRYGRWVDSPASRFIQDLPEGLMEEHTGPRKVREGQRKAMVAELFKKLDSLDAKATEVSQ